METKVISGVRQSFTLHFPAEHSPVFSSPGGVRYLKSPGVVLIGQPAVDITGMREFLEGFDPSLGFSSYVDDSIEDLPLGTHLCKTAGQTCYCSWGPGKRTMNAEAKRYILGTPEKDRKDGIVGQGHGSVLEHANYSFFIYGIGRSVTHELVRHRAGCAYSQVSQRYVDGTTLRFVMRPEYHGVTRLEERFYRNIQHAADQYRLITDELAQLQASGKSEILTGDKARDRRKKLQQAAREVLPNSAEAPITFTANARALRHTLEMRASEHAETEIRRLFMIIYRLIVAVEPIIFGDYEVMDLPDGTQCLKTDYEKV